jgi:hypothetical protein
LKSKCDYFREWHRQGRISWYHYAQFHLATDTHRYLQVITVSPTCQHMNSTCSWNMMLVAWIREW